MTEAGMSIFMLEANRQYESQIYKISKGSTIRFILGASLYGNDVTLFINNPRNGEKFSRGTFQKLVWKHHSSEFADEGNAYADCLFATAGTFKFYFTIGNESKENGSGFILVDPVLSINGTPLPLNGIQCQTVLSKCLGPLTDWDDIIAVSAAAKYNMVHFTPVQALGGSNSAYSLKDHMSLNETFTSKGKKPTFDDIKTFVNQMEKKHGLLSLTDIVLNHTANETPWLREHPECSFNAANSPHLRPAILLDQALYLLAMQAMRGETMKIGIPPEITKEAHIEAVRKTLQDDIVPSLRLYEFYQADIDRLVKGFEGNQAVPFAGLKDFKLKQTYVRFGAACDMNEAKSAFRTSEEFKHFLEKFNADQKRETANHLENGVENVVKGMQYHKIDPWGPKQHKITKENPLIVRYFLPNHDSLNDEITCEEMEECFVNEKGAYFMAHNGWVMGDDPLRNFALEGSMVYLRRELIAWGDSCKLRYGDKPSDCPFLWDYMTRYVTSSAEIFHGLRLDNCHSTPIHVAEYLLDAAREVRNDLYVIAELFTSSEAVDNIFVNRLGINSLIREALQAGDSHELGRLVHRYGGIPVGSFFHAKGIAPLMPSVAHAIFVDMTHDNPSPYEKRSVYDFLPSAALVSMASCATGSSRGYDELVPHHIHVVEESRIFENASTVAKLGIMEAKRALNELHYQLAMNDFVEVYVDQLNVDTVSVTRRCPNTDESVILVARTSFQMPANPEEKTQLNNLKISGKIQNVALEACTVLDATKKTEFKRSDKTINGLRNYKLELRTNFPASESEYVKIHEVDSEGCEVSFTNLKPGCVIAFRVKVGPSSEKAMQNARDVLKSFGYFKNPVSIPKQVISIIDKMDLDDLNRVLFRCDHEEKSDGFGVGAYSIDVLGAMVYCGLQGVMSHLSFIRPRNDLGHPLCSNIRNGDWLMDYIVNRLKPFKSCEPISNYLQEMFEPVRKLPHYLKPCYFDAVVTSIYIQLLNGIWSKMSKFISSSSDYTRHVALASVILTSYVYDSPLPPLSSKLSPPAPLKVSAQTKQFAQQCPSLAAGLPHFSTGYMRNWGRDTFIALRGLLLLTGRYSDARSIILGFAGTLRHGLIPNLLDRGTNSRYNCRDAVWFWLDCIKQYVEIVPEGKNILNDPVSRLYPSDDSEARVVDSVVMPLQDVIQEALQRHWDGIQFRERNAGTRIDSQMKDDGFNVTVGVDHSTGFVYGGNEFNCGTWMDKMGCIPGKNQGTPASPRDGSAVELVCLCKSIVSWLHQKNAEGIYAYDSVTEGDGKLKFVEWASRIQKNFEPFFWVPETGSGPHDSRPDCINRRGIYKDTLNSVQPWADYQFRPNFTVGMVAAPELFDRSHAQIALRNAQNILKGPLGMKTLDPGDMTYNGNYDNSDADGGFNYHRGPEWLWPTGYFLRSQLLFSDDLKETKKNVRKSLQAHFQAITDSPWRGLPELTNENGAYCYDSCPIQAWSHACILEVLFQLHTLGEMKAPRHQEP